jgi:hypothetical protein
MRPVDAVHVVTDIVVITTVAVFFLFVDNFFLVCFHAESRAPCFRWYGKCKMHSHIPAYNKLAAIHENLPGYVQVYVHVCMEYAAQLHVLAHLQTQPEVVPAKTRQTPQELAAGRQAIPNKAPLVIAPNPVCQASGGYPGRDSYVCLVWPAAVFRRWAIIRR